jgi:hypothetical protein
MRPIITFSHKNPCACVQNEYNSLLMDHTPPTNVRPCAEGEAIITGLKNDSFNVAFLHYGNYGKLEAGFQRTLN